MDNLEIYNRIFIKNFKVEVSQLDTLTYKSIAGWDSIGHMIMTSALEEAFGIMISPEDIIEFSSYTKGKEILKRYNIDI